MDGRISLGSWLVVGWLYRTNMYIESYILLCGSSIGYGLAYSTNIMLILIKVMY